MLEHVRSFSYENYKFGFNGKENDDEIKGADNWQNYGMRMYDPRLGRFPSIDPIFKKYPSLTPYQFASNSPIAMVDIDGLEGSLATLSLKPLGLRTVFGAIQKSGDVRAQNPGYTDIQIISLAYFRTIASQVHFTLDMVGLIPVAGEFPDAANGTLYMLEGDYSNASFSFAATIPIAGMAPTLSKWSKNVLKLSDNAFYSASGLIFRQGSKDGNRLAHVMEHMVNNTSKPLHGVFVTGTDGLIATLDEAWAMAQKGGKNVVVQVDKATGRTNYIVDMGKAIGYEGGSKGSGAALTKVQITIEKDTKSDVVTAFPTK